MLRLIIIMVGNLLTCSSLTAALGSAAGSVTEMSLPSFQQALLASDAPFQDVLIMPDQTTWLLGKTALWRWDVAKRALQRIRLPDTAPSVEDPAPAGSATSTQSTEPAASADPTASPEAAALATQRSSPRPRANLQLQKLGSDGNSVFVATNRSLFQLESGEARVLRYALPVPTGGEVHGFAGSGDNFWVVHSHALLFLDRYGKKLTAQRLLAPLRPLAHPVFAPATQTLWFRRGQALFAADARATRQVYQTQNPVLDLQAIGDDLVLSTKHTVLRLTAQGEARQSIPVENQRRLQAMRLTPTQHAYLFDDRSLEVFTPATRHAQRYMLPLDHASGDTRLALGQNMAAVLNGGSVRLFRLGQGQ